MSGAKGVVVNALEWEDADMIGFRLDDLLTQPVPSLPRAVASELRGFGRTLTTEQAERIAAGLVERWNSVLPEGQTAANMAAILRSAGIEVAPPRSGDTPRPLVVEIDPDQMTLNDVLDDVPGGA